MTIFVPKEGPVSAHFGGATIHCRRWFAAAICSISLFLFSGALTFSQSEPTTADQVIARYKDAIGASRFSAITTVAEHGELYGDLTPQSREQGTYEFYFKSPNFRFSSSLDEKKRVISLSGCDGKISWMIDQHLKRFEFKPKPGHEYECGQGFDLIAVGLRDEHLKMRLGKKKEVDGRMAWEVKVDDSESHGSTFYYFDAETYLLLRIDMMGSHITYSDYRDVGGFKVAFKTIHEFKSAFANSKMVTTVRELQVNVPIEDTRFVEPGLKNGGITPGSAGSSQTNHAESTDTGSPAAATASENPVSSAVPSKTSSPPKPTSVTEVNFPNFTLCTTPELQAIVTELRGLKPVQDQQKLSDLLDKVGAKTVEIAHNTPNLISRETVTELPQGEAESRYDYDYLILTRLEGNSVGLSEFRLDLKTGEKFQTEDVVKDPSSTWAAVERASQALAASRSRRPNSQGFAVSWVHFYTPNRPQATFRYLGEQKMSGHRTLVVAFAQKPESVLTPAKFLYEGKTVPMFLQGVAWVDASDFRIVRLRTDLLFPIPEVSLHRLTADIQFEPTRIQEVPSLLSLPREVEITSETGGSGLREIHKYSGYRLFRARSKIVLK